MKKHVCIIGGGAAGFFAAIHAAEKNPEAAVTILEGGRECLSKVRISGGGRCNVTNNTFDIRELCMQYPRGARELRGAFSRFAVRDTIEWFEQQGVALKTEADRRMFPVTDSSDTIVDCLMAAARERNVNVRLNAKVVAIVPGEEGRFLVTCRGRQADSFDAVILATGGNKNSFSLAKNLGHTIVDPVPSLFTFQIDHPLLQGLAGISFPNASLQLQAGTQRFSVSGPVLITHWGLSGPAVIKLSALAARPLYESDYQGVVTVAFSGDDSVEHTLERLQKSRQHSGKKNLAGVSVYDVPRRFWQRIIEYANIPRDKRLGDCTRPELRSLAEITADCPLPVQGKGVFKEEFVTCGGALLREVDFRTMQSRRVPGLSFAGEILDIDGITGGFNFQSAWTTGYIAGNNCLNITSPCR